MITQPSSIIWGNVVTTNPTNATSANGKIIVAATGGIGPKTYSALPTSTQMPSGSFINLSGGNYVITATDANGCAITTTVTITNPLIVTNQTSNDPTKESGDEVKPILVYPNPLLDEINVRLKSTSNTAAYVSIINVSGASVLKNFIDVKAGINNYSFDVHSLKSGMYILQMTLFTGEQYRQVVKK
jgi:hypothetical protein